MADAVIRWRMILGKFAAAKLSCTLNPEERRREQVLDFLYGREYRSRGIWQGDRQGSLDPTQLTVPEWIKEAKKLFPRETLKIIEKHALEKYGLSELLLDKEIIHNLTPNKDLLKMILMFKGRMQPDVLDEARRIIRIAIREIVEQLTSYIRRAFSGRLNRFRKSRLKNAQNFDWRSTVRKNLKHYEKQRQLLIPRELIFYSRVKKEMPWEIILCVDSSGSMFGSVIHSAVMAGIFAGLPAIRVKLVIFDTAVVDLSAHIHDPVEIFLSIQMGGGTNIGGALGYCEQLVKNPQRTILILLTDFCEGASPRLLFTIARRLVESGVRLLGLTALDAEAMPIYDEQIAGTLASLGMQIAALTPKELVQWLKKVIS